MIPLLVAAAGAPWVGPVGCAVVARTALGLVAARGVARAGETGEAPAQNGACPAGRSAGPAGDERHPAGRQAGGPAAAPEALVPQLDDGVLLATDEEGTFLVFGGELPGLDVLPLSLFSDADRRVLGEAVAGSMGVLNAAAQLAQGISEASGLVRLAPETMQLLKAGAQPLAKNGWNLGTLMTDGKFARQVRWLPAGSAGAVGVLAALGPAATLVAIQWQLAQISRLVERNIALTSTVLQLVRGEQWAEVRGQHDAVLAELRHARAVGAVTPQIWAHAQAQASESVLRKDMVMFFEHVQRHAGDLAPLRGAKARREWLAQNCEAVLRDVDALLMAHRAWFVYQGLRAGQLSETSASDPRDAALQAEVVREARALSEQVLAACEPVLDSLYRHFRLMETCPGGMGVTIRGRTRVPAEVAEAAGALATQVAQLRGRGAAADPQAPEPTHGWFDVTQRRVEVADRLRWVLNEGEQLIAVSFGSASFWGWFTNGYVAFTDRRMLFLEVGSFLREGAVDREVLWADVAELVCERGKNWEGGPDLQVRGESDFRVAFTSATALYQVRDLATVLTAQALGGRGDGGPEIDLPSGTAGGADGLAAAD